MATQPVSIVQEGISHTFFTNLVALVLSGAAVLGQTSLATAQVGNPFGVPCDSVGTSGIPYVPGVNCRVMAVDGYTRQYMGYGRRRAGRCSSSGHAPRAPVVTPK